MPVAPSDKIDADILPDPELNPLLNPLLAAHMGRWAEVYFTSPPEKRGQAVSDLVRELRSGRATESVAVPAAVDKSQKSEEAGAPKILSGPPAQQPSPALMDSRQTCGACSADNPAEQKFCGMCGMPLQSLPPRDESKFRATAPASEADWNETQTSGEPESSMVSYSTEYAREPSLSFGGYARHDSSRREWSVPQEDLPHFAIESESVPYRYRLYIGIAVAVILGGLLYMAWNRTPGASGDTSESVPSRVIPAAPARATPPAAQEASSAPKRTVLPTDQAAAASSGTADPAAAAPASRPVETQNQPAASPRKDEVPQDARASTPRMVPVAENSSVTANNQGGEEEFATAEKYLNRSNRGAARDNREAAAWLWKAVGKGNLAATMTLSDLYLRGDGVPKSCDQARLLLVVAARKGKASAGERLRNLQAFGCQ
jgi:hypothetical protein